MGEIESEDNDEKLYVVKEGSKPKIRRIALKQSGLVEIVRVESPSSFFVRPINHIRNSLVYTEPLKLERLENFAIGDFAIAPIEERTMGRCMILKKYSTKKCAKVFFIDEAITAFVADECIFQIDPVECEYPWQVIHVSLGKVYSIAEGGWTEEQCTVFRNIISKFERFEIVTCEYEMSKDVNRSTVLAVLYGMDINMNMSQKVSIENILASMCNDVVLTIFPRNLFDHPTVWDLDVEADTNENLILIDDIRKRLPLNWQREKPKYSKEIENDWNIEDCNIQSTSKTIAEFSTQRNTIFGFIEYGKNESPTETFIRPMKPRDEMDSDAFIEDFEELEEFNEMLNRFYQKKINQKPLSLEEISTTISEGKMFAICNMANPVTGHRNSWLRVEILKLRGESVEVRFIDVGGTSFVRLRLLHRIYKPHTLKHQYCLHVSFPLFYELDNGRKDRNEYSSYDLSPECRQLWVSLLRYDVPVEINISEITDSDIVTCKDIRFCDTNESLCESFISKSDGKIVRIESSTDRTESISGLDSSEESEHSTRHCGRREIPTADYSCATLSDVTI